MNTLENYLKTRSGEETFSERFGMKALRAGKTEWHKLASELKSTDGLQFGQLVCLSAIDRKEEGFELFAHLRSESAGEEMVLFTLIEKDQDVPQIESLCDLWGSAELFEDEVYDLFGIEFTNHPFLRRIMLGEDFEGYPLRKSYQLPEND